jgi:hypothetical protein
MQDADAGKRQHNLKRKRARERGNITRFVTEVGKFTDTTTIEDYEYYQDRLREGLGRLTSLDDDIHELIDDSEYDADVQICEEYMEYAIRTILRTSRQIEKHLTVSTAKVTITDAHEAAPTLAPIAPSTKIRLHAIKLEPFSGDMGTLLGRDQAVNRQRSVVINHQHILTGLPRRRTKALSRENCCGRGNVWRDEEHS